MRHAWFFVSSLVALTFAACSKDSPRVPGSDAGDDERPIGGAAGMSMTPVAGGGSSMTGGSGVGGGSGFAGTVSPAGGTGGSAALTGGAGSGGDLGACPVELRGKPRPGPCSTPDDTDRDGVINCEDPCPYDEHKLEPGICGCGRPDIDSDGDGVADCVDHCPLDPNNTQRVDCGCQGTAVITPAGTPCLDLACASTTATCDGAGRCGDPSSCSPCPGGHFIIPSPTSGYFWFCGALPPVTGPGCVLEDGGGGPAVTRAEAKAACAAKGLALVRIHTMTENETIAQLLTSRVWLGANDLEAPDQWYWPSATSDSDALFWTGGVEGSRTGGTFSNWADGAPAGKPCASMDPVTGLWSDTDCNEKLSYICERPVTI